MKWSAVAILRVSGPNLDVDGFIDRYAWPVEVVWRHGEGRPRGGVHDESGFNLTVATDASSGDALEKELSRFLETTTQLGAELTAEGAGAELDIGLMVGAGAPTSVAFVPELLAKLAQQGIALRVRCYPCSEDQTDEHAT